LRLNRPMGPTGANLLAIPAIAFFANPRRALAGCWSEKCGPRKRTLSRTVGGRILTPESTLSVPLRSVHTLRSTDGFSGSTATQKQEDRRKWPYSDNGTGVGLAADVVVVTPEDIERFGDSPALIIEPAPREGKVVYAASPNRYPPDDPREWLNRARFSTRRHRRLSPWPLL
jgi:hypothetical protein